MQLRVRPGGRVQLGLGHRVDAGVDPRLQQAQLAVVVGVAHRPGGGRVTLGVGHGDAGQADVAGVGHVEGVDHLLAGLGDELRRRGLHDTQPRPLLDRNRQVVGGRVGLG